MRKIYFAVLKEYFHKRLIETRSAQKLTQAQMASCLEMDDRSYIDLDHGKSCCSSLTLALFLIYCCDDPLLYLQELRCAFKEAADHAA